MTRVSLRWALMLVVSGSAFACAGETPSSPTAVTTPTTPTTRTWASIIGPGGAASQSMTASQAGTVTLTLNSAGPSADVLLGFGIGVPTAERAGCGLGKSVEARPSASPALTVAVEAGNYCIKVYDPGNVTTDIQFSLTVVYP
jgi:hypothetical protein